MKLTLNEVTGEVRHDDGSTFCYIAQSGYDNAAYIIRACNSHSDLVEALESLAMMVTVTDTGAFPTKPAFEKAVTVLKRAKGEA